MKKLIISICLLVVSNALATPGYFRSPGLHKDTLVFTAEGDLWVCPLDQTKAWRLTTHPAEEKQAAISPDGRYVAFAADYEGAVEAYVIPIAGGLAKRISFENDQVRVQGWTPSGRVLYSTNNHVGPVRTWVLRMVDPETLESETIPVMDTAEGSIDAGEESVFFTRNGLQLTVDNVKVYRGGAAGELWRYRLGSQREAEKLTKKHEGSARKPMVADTRLFFISDAGGNDNIWSMDLNGENIEQVTRHDDFSVRGAAYHSGKIAYQLGADLYLLDLSTNQSRLLDIQLASDFSNFRERWINKPMAYVTSTRLSGNGNKVVVTARGRVALAGVNNERLVEIAAPDTARLRKAVQGPDDNWVYAISDSTGESEIWRFAADGSHKSERLTMDGDVFRWNLYPSPDGKWLVHDDKHGDLWLLNTETKKNERILSGHVGLDPYPDVVWSDNSQLIAITRAHVDDERTRIVLYRVKDGKRQVLTSDKYSAYSPAFDSGTKWLYFLSDREFKPSPGSPWGDRNMGVDFDRRTLIFAFGLTADGKFPFQKPNELHREEEKQKEITNEEKEEKIGENESDAKNEDERVDVIVDWDGIRSRLWQIPVKADNYENLFVGEKHLYVQQGDFFTRVKKTEIKVLELKPFSELKTFTDDVDEYMLSGDRKKMFVRKSGDDNLFIVEAGDTFPKETKQAKVSTDQWQIAVDPRLEWQQMFHDAWLQHRDSFFDPDLRSVDWDAVREKYKTLLARLTDRRELNDVLAQMVSELNALHSQIRGGDYPEDSESPKAASLGALLTQTREGVRIDRIYRHDPDLPLTASPLNQPGVDAEEGDVVRAVNGVEVDDLAAFHLQLRNQVGKQVLLSLSRGGESIKTVAIPVAANRGFDLRYQDWVLGNREKVAESEAGLGYIHLYAMGPNDVSNFAREFYHQYKKNGLIIDVRRNRGGNVDSLILEKLIRRAWMFWQPVSGQPYTNMQNAFRGHLVVLTDEFTYSDGETFTAGFKALDLGTVIGKQTAGAGVWLSGRNRLVDTGMARVAEYPVFSIDGRWLVEGRGITPDLEVDNLPHATFNGKDLQLETAIEYLREKIRREPIPPLKAKPYPPHLGAGEDIIYR